MITFPYRGLLGRMMRPFCVWKSNNINIIYSFMQAESIQPTQAETHGIIATDMENALETS